MGVTFLLDTHVVLWLWGDPDRVAVAVRDELADPANRVLVSAASAMEVSMKARLGKLPLGAAVVSTWSAHVARIAAEELPVSAEHAVLAGSMTWEHRDPFDRLLVAQALVEGATLVSADAVMTQVAGLRLVRP